MSLESTTGQQEGKSSETKQDGKASQEGVKAEIAGPIQQTRERIFARITNYQELNAVLGTCVDAAIQEALDDQQIGWFDKERIKEIKGFIMRVAKQRGWEKEQVQEAASKIIEKLAFTGDIRTSQKMNRISRLLEKTVDNIYFKA
jgi:hypothetical protein